MVLSTVKDFFQAPCVPQNSPNLGICQPAPIRHGGEGGGGPTAGQARAPGREELERQPVTRRKVRGCAEGRWERGLGFPARGRKAAGSAPGREPRNHCGRASRAPPGRGWGCARSRLRGLFFFSFLFFLFSFLSFFLFLWAPASSPQLVAAGGPGPPGPGPQSPAPRAALISFLGGRHAA